MKINTEIILDRDDLEVFEQAEEMIKAICDAVPECEQCPFYHCCHNGLLPHIAENLDDLVVDANA